MKFLTVFISLWVACSCKHRDTSDGDYPNVQFKNTVRALCPPEQLICRVNLRLRRMETNVVFNFGEFTSVPIVEINGTLYKRDRRLIAECDSVLELEEGGK